MKWVICLEKSKIGMNLGSKVKVSPFENISPKDVKIACNTKI